MDIDVSEGASPAHRMLPENVDATTCSGGTHLGKRRQAIGRAGCV